MKFFKCVVVHKPKACPPKKLKEIKKCVEIIKKPPPKFDCYKPVKSYDGFA